MESSSEYYDEQLIKIMIREKDKLPYIFENIDVKHFRKDSPHRVVFYTIAMLWKNQKTITVQAIDANSYHVLDDKVFSSYLDKISSEEPEVTLDECISFIRERYTKGVLRSNVSMLNTEVSKPNPDFDKIANIAENIISLIDDKLPQLATIENLFDPDEYLEFKNQFLKERFVIHKKNLTFIAGAAKNMKTSLATFMANDLLENGYKVIIFPVDGSYKETIVNFVSMRTRINRELILLSKKTPGNPYGKLTKEEFEKVNEEIKLFKSKFIETGKLLIDDKSSSLPEINLRIRTFKPDIAIIDLINSIVLPTVEKGETTEAFYTPIVMNRLKQLSKQVNCAILGLMWLKTTKNRPSIMDAYGSHAAEKWASKVWMVYYNYTYSMIPGFKTIFEIIDGVSRFGINRIYPAKVIPEYCIFDFSDHDNQIRQLYMNYTKMPPGQIWKSGDKGESEK